MFKNKTHWTKELQKSLEQRCKITVSKKSRKLRQNNIQLGLREIQCNNANPLSKFIENKWWMKSWFWILYYTFFCILWFLRNSPVQVWELSTGISQRHSSSRALLTSLQICCCIMSIRVSLQDRHFASSKENSTLQRAQITKFPRTNENFKQWV